MASKAQAKASLKPKDPRRSRRSGRQEKAKINLKIIKPWKEENSTQTEKDDFNWTQSQQEEVERLEEDIRKLTKSICLIDSPDSP